MKLSYNAIQVLKNIILFTGEKEVNAQGNDVLVTRRLNVDESSQRRFFLEEIKSTEKEVNSKVQPLVQAHNQLISDKQKEVKEKNPIGEKESVEVYEKRINVMLNGDIDLVQSAQSVNAEIQNQSNVVFDVNVTDKTSKVLKKYFVEYGVNYGFHPSEDKIVEEITNELK